MDHTDLSLSQLRAWLDRIVECRGAEDFRTGAAARCVVSEIEARLAAVLEHYGCLDDLPRGGEFRDALALLAHARRIYRAWWAAQDRRIAA